MSSTHFWFSHNLNFGERVSCSLCKSRLLFAPALFMTSIFSYQCPCPCECDSLESCTNKKFKTKSTLRIQSWEPWSLLQRMFTLFVVSSNGNSCEPEQMFSRKVPTTKNYFYFFGLRVGKNTRIPSDHQKTWTTHFQIQSLSSRWSL
jgi:hypothetical protein